MTSRGSSAPTNQVLSLNGFLLARWAASLYAHIYECVSIQVFMFSHMRACFVSFVRLERERTQTRFECTRWMTLPQERGPCFMRRVQNQNYVIRYTCVYVLVANFESLVFVSPLKSHTYIRFVSKYTRVINPCRQVHKLQLCTCCCSISFLRGPNLNRLPPLSRSVSFNTAVGCLFCCAVAVLPIVEPLRS